MKRNDLKYHVEFDVDFKRNPYSGLYIALEGIDGSGKSTQARELEEYFTKQGREVIRTREPRKEEGIIGKLLKETLHGEQDLPAIAFQYLFTADRAIHQEELITPALKNGKVVITDRCFWSAVPYGILDRGEELGVDPAIRMLVAQSILSMYHQFIVPDKTFYLEIGVDESFERVLGNTKEQREIYEKKELIQKAYDGYQLLLDIFPEEFEVIDAHKSVEDVTEEIVTAISKVRIKN